MPALVAGPQAGRSPPDVHGDEFEGGHNAEVPAAALSHPLPRQQLPKLGCLPIGQYGGGLDRPLKVSHTRPALPMPCRMTIKVESAPSGGQPVRMPRMPPGARRLAALLDALAGLSPSSQQRRTR